MATKRLNTNLVAALTVTVMLATVVVVGIFTYVRSHRPAEEYAKLARSLEARGDRERAAREYMRAYSVDRDSQYRIEAARVWFEAGNIRQSLDALTTGVAAAPQDVAVLHTLLEQLWQLTEFGTGQTNWHLMRDYSLRLLEVPGHEADPLGLLSRAESLRRLGESPDEVAERFQQVLAIAPTEPRVVLVQAERLLDPEHILREAGVSRDAVRRDPALAARLVQSARDAARAVLEAGLVANPQHPRMVVALADLVAGGGPDGPQQARALLEQAVAANPDHPSLRLGMARLLLLTLTSADPPLTGAARAALLDEVRSQIAAGLKAEPGLYEAYELEARCALLAEGGTPAERYRAALAVCDRAMEETVGVATLRATLGRGRYAELLYNAFNTAMQYWQQSTAPEDREYALARAAAYTAASVASFPEALSTPLMEGTLAIARDDQPEALQKLTLAVERSRGQPSPLFVEAALRLARLHLGRQQAGEADKLADESAQYYLTRGMPVPSELEILKVQVLLQLNRMQEALDRLDVLGRQLPDNREVSRMRAGALAALGRQDEAQAALAELEAGGGARDVQLQRAAVAINARDWNTAEQVLTELLEARPDDRAVLQMLVEVATQAERRPQLQARLEALLERTTDDRARRALRQGLVVIGTADPDERNAQLEAVLRENPDALERASDLYRFYRSRNRLDDAQRMLDELATLQRGDADAQQRLLVEQFELALQRQDYSDRAGGAEFYLKPLAAQNVDRVGGARFRGLLALARGDAARAVLELSAADRVLRSDALLKVQLAQAYLLEGASRLGEAQAALEEALRISPRDAQAARLLFLVRARQGLGNDPADDDEFRRLLTTASELNAGDPDLQPYLEDLRERDDPRAAITQREERRARDPNDLGNLTRLARLYLSPKVADGAQAGAVLAAGAPLAAAADLSDPAQRAAADAYYRQATQFHAAQRDRDSGVALLETYVARASGTQRIQALGLLAAFLETIGDTEAAGQAFERARALVDEVAPAGFERMRLRADVDMSYAAFLRRSRQLAPLVDIYRNLLDTLVPERVSATEADVIRRDRREVHLRLIQTLVDQGRLNDADTETDAFLRAYGNDAQGMLAQAVIRRLRNRLDESVTILTRAVELAAGEPEVLTRVLQERGRVFLDLGRVDAARDDLLAVKRAEPPETLNLAARLMLADSYRMTQQPELAENELREALQHSGLRPEARGQVVGALVQLFERTGRGRRAQELLSENAAADPRNAAWPYQLARSLAREGAYAAAADAMKRAVDLTERRNDVVVAEWLELLALAGRPQEAVAAFEQLPDEVRAPPVRVAAAKAYRAAQRLDDAAREVQEAIAGAARVENLAALRQITESLLRQTRIEGQPVAFFAPAEIIDAFSTLAETAPVGSAPGVRLRATLADLLEGTGQRDAALQLLDATLPHAPPNSGEHIAMQLTRAQALHRAQGFTDDVRTAYERVLEVAPDNVTALNNLAFLLAENDAPQEALKYAERLRLLPLDNVATWDTVGVVLMRNERWDEALVAFNRALAIETTDEAQRLYAQLHLGELLAQRGRLTEARRALREALDLATQAGNEALQRRAQELLDGLN